VKRREFITLLGGAATALPLAARAQQATMPVVGFLSSRAPEDSTHLLVAYRLGLAEGGFVEGQNGPPMQIIRWPRVLDCKSKQLSLS
jgi:putative ABC transport system substrate-binding protein